MNHDKVLRLALQDPNAIIAKSHFRKQRTWKFCFMADEKAAYWWKAIAKKPIVSKPLIPEMRLLRECITDIYGDSEHLQHLFIALYMSRWSKLAPHQDDEFSFFLKAFEDVIATFGGAPRVLAVGPACQYMKMRRFPPFKINCSSSNIVRMLPIANELFVHTKLPSSSDSPSITYT